MRRLLVRHRSEFFLASALFILAVALRLYRIDAYVHFLGDEGRDMRIVRAIYTAGDLPFLGPNASVGGFFLGPMYYWMIAPFLWLWQSNPVGPAIMVAVFGIATVIGVYLVSRMISGTAGALIALLLYSIAPIVVRYSRFSWNPNPVPFFSLIAVGSIYLASKTKQSWWWFISGAAMGMNVQLHYLTTVLFPVTGLSIALTTPIRRWWKAFGLMIAGFLLTYAPFLLFEIKHNFPNHRTILEFVTRKEGAVHPDPLTLIRTFHEVGVGLYRVLFPTAIEHLPAVLFWGSLVFLIGVVSHAIVKQPSSKHALMIVAVWFVGGILGLSAYQGAIYDYYYGFLYPVPFLLFALLIHVLWNLRIGRLARWSLKIGIVVLAVVFSVLLAQGLYIWQGPQHIVRQTRDIANFVLDKTDGKPYNFALLAERNSDNAYRYFFELAENPPIDIQNPTIDPERKTVTQQLFIICEQQTCAPLGHPKWEVAGFGQAEIVGQWYMIGGITVQKLVHFKEK